MVHWRCRYCEHRWRGHGRGRHPSGEVYCPECGRIVYTFSKPLDSRLKRL